MVAWRKGEGVGKRVYTFPNINQHGPLGNTFPFANVSSFCQMLSLGCPQPKAGVSTVAFLVLEREGVWILTLCTCPGPLLGNEVPGPQLSEWDNNCLRSAALSHLLSVTQPRAEWEPSDSTEALGETLLHNCSQFWFALDAPVFFSQHNFLPDCWNMCAYSGFIR